MPTSHSNKVITIGNSIDSKNNNFDVLRLIAALCVLISHSYFFTGTVAYEPFYNYLGGYETGGGWGVGAFFTISGFLVTRSVESRDVLKYLKARALRIVPGLAVVSIITAFVIGPLVSLLPTKTYFLNADTYAYLLNATIFNIHYSLPGVFESHIDHAPNGSLWTLPIETSFYVLLALLITTGTQFRRLLFLLTVVVFGLYLYAINIRGLSFSNQADDVFWGVSIFACLNFGIYFLLGSLMWLYRDKVPLTLGYALVMLLLLFMAREGIAKQAVFHIAFPYLVIFIALYKKIELPIYHRIGDISYGVYIYAMPIQQAVIHFMGGKISPNKVTIYSLPIVIMLAIASWKLIEEPALKRKSS